MPSIAEELRERWRTPRLSEFEERKMNARYGRLRWSFVRIDENELFFKVLSRDGRFSEARSITRESLRQNIAAFTRRLRPSPSRVTTASRNSARQLDKIRATSRAASIAVGVIALPLFDDEPEVMHGSAIRNACEGNADLSEEETVICRNLGIRREKFAAMKEMSNDHF